MKRLVLFALMVSAPAFEAGPNGEHDLHPAVGEVRGGRGGYRRLWAEEGPTIIQGMERGSGLTFLEKEVKAVIFEATEQLGIRRSADDAAGQLSARREESHAGP